MLDIRIMITPFQGVFSLSLPAARASPFAALSPSFGGIFVLPEREIIIDQPLLRPSLRYRPPSGKFFFFPEREIIIERRAKPWQENHKKIKTLKGLNFPKHPSLLPLARDVRRPGCHETGLRYIN